MLRLSLPWLYELSKEVQSASNISFGTESTVADVFLEMYTLKLRIAALLNESVYSNSLRVCRASGRKLIDTIDSIFAAEWTEPINQYMKANFTAELQAFEVTFKAELEVVNAYFVTNKRGYDTFSLIENAEIIFPPDLLEKVPGIEFDIKEAGKCIAFELPTAAGFHLLRALETVITTYWAAVMNNAPLPAERNLGQYITKMTDAKIPGTDKALAALKQIKDLHRNPLMHPEDKLNVDECIGLLNIIQSAMVAMLQRIPAIPKTMPLQLDYESGLVPRLPASSDAEIPDGQ